MDARKERYTMKELALAMLPPGAEKRLVANRVKLYYVRAKSLGIKPDELHRLSYADALRILAAPLRATRTRAEIIDPLRRALQEDGYTVGKR